MINIKQALELSDRREKLCRLKPCCPSCGRNQVQLVNYFVNPSQWKCRECKTKFTLELQIQVGFERSKLMTISYTNKEGIEIDHGDEDLSAAFRNDIIEIGIGKNYGDGPGGSYEHWADIKLTIEEARAFHEWLESKLVGL